MPEPRASHGFAQIAARNRNDAPQREDHARVFDRARQGGSSRDNGGASSTEIAESGIREAGGVPTFKGYNGFPASICASINEEVVHGIPGARMLREGDLLSIDIGTTLEGYVSDSAITVPVGNVPQDARRLLERDSRMPDDRDRADAARASTSATSARRCKRTRERHGFGVVRELVGHGVGRAMHEEPQVPNYGDAGTGMELRPGLVLAIEPMITQGSLKVRHPRRRLDSRHRRW